MSFCFAVGTLIQTHHDQQNIEDLRVGDEVLSYNEQTGQTEYQPITALYAHQNALVLNVTVEGEPEPLKVTPEHPFLAYRARNDLSSEDPDPDSQPKGKWIEAGHLKVGDQLRTATGTWVAITDIKAGGSVEWAYNLEVAENHSYAVGGSRLVVHNSGEDPCPDLKTMFKELRKLKKGSEEHKSLRWKIYQLKNIDNPERWDFERWSNSYKVNLTNAKQGNKARDLYREHLGWGTAELEVDVEGVVRKLDIGDAATLRGVEVKTGYYNLDRSTHWEILRDEILIEHGWDIEWHFAPGARAGKSLIERLQKAKIRITGIEKL